MFKTLAFSFYKSVFMSFLTPLNLPLAGTNKLEVSSAKFDLAEFSFGLFEQFQITAPEQIVNSVAKRQAEFLAGRYCAHKALQQLSSEVHEVVIGNNRAPVWPNGIVGSITHCDDLAICCVASADTYNRLGVDAEKLISNQTIEQVSSITLTEDECALLRALPVEFNKVFTLAFSAKESLFKALYPEVNRYFEFLDARIVKIDVEQNRFVLALTNELTEQLPIGTEVQGKFSFIEGDTVVTLIADKG